MLQDVYKESAYSRGILTSGMIRSVFPMARLTGRRSMTQRQFIPSFVFASDKRPQSLGDYHLASAVFAEDDGNLRREAHSRVVKAANVS